jgi:hypothetical protein
VVEILFAPEPADHTCHGSTKWVAQLFGVYLVSILIAYQRELWRLERSYRNARKPIFMGVPAHFAVLARVSESRGLRVPHSPLHQFPSPNLESQAIRCQWFFRQMPHRPQTILQPWRRSPWVGSSSLFLDFRATTPKAAQAVTCRKKLLLTLCHAPKGRAAKN